MISSSRASSTFAWSLQSTMPNGGSHFRSALQREPPSCDHTSDEEWVQEAKRAWPRPRTLTLWTMRAWQTFISRSRIVKSLTLHRVIPEAVLALVKSSFGILLSFWLVGAIGLRQMSAVRMRQMVRAINMNSDSECGHCLNWWFKVGGSALMLSTSGATERAACGASGRPVAPVDLTLCARSCSSSGHRLFVRSTVLVVVRGTKKVAAHAAMIRKATRLW